ncbi:MAG: dienelactone hydrolase family protein [Candidatus Hydrogenedentes bacterium]|nr:dienelactone hydrolase family protein [Candidatus Hydrogenedentota bacterium]
MDKRINIFTISLLVFEILLTQLTVSASFDCNSEFWFNAFRMERVNSGEVEPKLPPYEDKFRFSVKTNFLGKQLVRVSLPLPYGFATEQASFEIRDHTGNILEPDYRVLTTYGGDAKYVKRMIISFVDEFTSGQKEYLLIKGGPSEKGRRLDFSDFSSVKIGDLLFSYGDGRLEAHTPFGKVTFTPFLNGEKFIAEEEQSEIVEFGKFYIWIRWLMWHKEFPSILELRANSLGQFSIKFSLQRWAEEDGYSPEFGFFIDGEQELLYSKNNGMEKISENLNLDFSSGVGCQLYTSSMVLGFPDAHCWKKGGVSASYGEKGWTVKYFRSRGDDRVPHQPMAWRTACVYLGPKDQPMWDELLEGQVKLAKPLEFYGSLIGVDSISLPENEIVRKCIEWHRNAMRVSRLYGDDYGNLSSLPQNSVFGMNRLNHNTEIYREYLRTGDDDIRKTFLLWCQNFSQLSIWWGDCGKEDFGGTRYNNINASDPSKHANDKEFMWRSNKSVSFCTKGFANFLFAYEETGDPFYGTSLKWQTEYAKKSIHANTGECRNIGVVDDFMLLYRSLGKKELGEESLRLFRELREKLNENYLFSQGGQPILKDTPFIDDDQTGYKNPFPKPYILGYALQGLPQLYELYPGEPALYETIEAVAKFLADTVDPVGGWRYPHPKSSRVLVNQGLEHAHQLMNACAVLKDRSPYFGDCLKAIEKVLQARMLGFMFKNSIFSGLNSWEYSAGLVRPGNNLESIYKRFEEKDYSRDYLEGDISISDSAPPEGIVYFTSVLGFYASQRSVENLLIPGTPELKAVLSRLLKRTSTEIIKECSIERDLPLFTSQWLKQLTPSLRFDPIRFGDFHKWRETARKVVFESLGAPPPFEFFNPTLICEEDRGQYIARKVVLNISTWERIPGYLLIPKGSSPFPAILCLHDHGAHFSIGKEKVIAPIMESREIEEDAKNWVEKYYGGRFIGDELAKRGYVVFAIDALFWGKRQQCEGSRYENQQKVASNIYHLGTTWLGIITWDDIRSIDFLRSLPEVDPNKIGAIGLSMGAHRTWMLSALSDKVKVGCSICWMATTKSLMVPGNNQTLGQSAYSMLAPNLTTLLDIPDVASLACPKPMLFFSGRYDSLFPIEGVEESFLIMEKVWKSQDKSEYLYTKIWDVEHMFNLEMQEEAFNWFDKFLKSE